MFTGIIEQQGLIKENTSGRLHIEAAPSLMQELTLGASVSVNGACLTVVEMPAKSVFVADVMPETAKRTTLGKLRAGSFVNLELPLTLQARVGGHVVQGHVDGVGKVVRIKQNARSRVFTFSAPADILSLLVEKGSVAIDGVSLTVIDAGAKSFSVGIIPHTRDATMFSRYKLGDEVNIEVDILAKYVRAFIRPIKKNL